MGERNSKAFSSMVRFRDLEVMSTQQSFNGKVVQIVSFFRICWQAAKQDSFLWELDLSVVIAEHNKV